MSEPEIWRPVGTARLEGTYVRFVELPRMPKRKAAEWAIKPKVDGTLAGPIGRVGWYGPWRKYAFFPRPETVYEQVCLREIADFCEARTREHRAAPRPENEGKEGVAMSPLTGG